MQPFFTSACTNAEVDFYTPPGAAGNAPRAGAGGNDESGSAGRAHAGAAAGVDAGAGGSSGEADEGGAAGSGDAGSGEGGVPNIAGMGGKAGHGGNAGLGGTSGAGGNGGNAGRGGSGTGGTGGTGGASAGAGGVSSGGRAGAAGANTGGSGGHTGGSAGSGGSSGGGAGGGAAVCGNAVLEKGEQCDDGNTANLDACSATCAFEQNQRANLIELKFKPSNLCSKNAFGGAFEGATQAAVQAILDQRVGNGSLSLLFAFRGLHDLTGMSAETITLGMAYGVPSTGTGYDGKKDLDWWYTPANGQVDSNGMLFSTSTGALADGVLDASPDSLRIPLLSDLPIYMSSVKVRLSIGDSSAPLASTGVAPGHLASEHVRSGLVSFASAGPPAPVSADPGQLCGGLSTASLSAIAIPAAYAVGGSSACVEGYPASRSWLDLLVGGCHVAADELVAHTQPDQSDPGLPAVGYGAPYKLVADSSTKAVTGCLDKANSPVTLSACLNAAAYSAAFRVKTGRVIIK